MAVPMHPFAVLHQVSEKSTTAPYSKAEKRKREVVVSSSKSYNEHQKKVIKLLVRRKRLLVLYVNFVIRFGKLYHHGFPEFSFRHPWGIIVSLTWRSCPR